MRFANPSNIEAKYEAVHHIMRMARACGATHIKIQGDSNLIAQQVMKECDTTCANMIAYCAMYEKIEGNFEGCEVTHIGRGSNKEADSLANIGSSAYPSLQEFSLRRFSSGLSKSSQRLANQH
jgi:ribonuclease HI